MWQGFSATLIFLDFWKAVQAQGQKLSKEFKLKHPKSIYATCALRRKEETGLLQLY